MREFQFIVGDAEYTDNYIKASSFEDAIRNADYYPYATLIYCDELGINLDLPYGFDRQVEFCRKLDEKFGLPRNEV